MSGILEESDDQKHVSENKTLYINLRQKNQTYNLRWIAPKFTNECLHAVCALFQHNSSAGIYLNKVGVLHKRLTFSSGRLTETEMTFVPTPYTVQDLTSDHR